MLLTIYLIAIWFLKLPTIDTSKTDYCKIAPKRHFLCEDETKSGHVCAENTETHPRNNGDRIVALKALNDIRAGVANGVLQIGYPKFTPPQAANMYELKWDDECEKAARNIVKYCFANPQFHGNFSNIFARFEAGLYLDLGYYGSIGHNPTLVDLLWDRIKSDKYPIFQDTSISSGYITGKGTTPFYDTKLSIWLKAEVSVVGCSMVVQKKGLNIDCNIACVFGGITTWLNKPLNLYENGSPCSLCPPDSQCSRAYPGLCECKKRCYSYSKDVKKSGFYNSYAIVVDKETNEDKIVPLEVLAKESYESTYRYLHTTPTTTIITTSDTTVATKMTTHMEPPIINLTTTKEFPTTSKLPTSRLLKTMESPYAELIATQHSTTAQELAIKPPDDYELDYVQNFEPIAKTTDISSRPTTVSITMPSAYRSAVSSPDKAYFQALTMFTIEMVLFLML